MQLVWVTATVLVRGFFFKKNVKKKEGFILREEGSRLVWHLKACHHLLSFFCAATDEYPL